MIDARNAIQCRQAQNNRGFVAGHSVDEGGTLLQVLDMLEDVDILRLAHTSNALHGISQRYLA